MEPTFFNKEIVWAKVKGYPWWPAEISKLPTPDTNFFKVIFIAEDTHAFLNPKDVRKYTDFHDECSKKKMRGLASAIQAADELHRKRIETQTKIAPPADPPTAKKTRSKQPLKQKGIRKANKTRGKVESEESQREQSQNSQVSQQKASAVRPELQPANSFQKQQSEGNSQENIQEQKFFGESEEKADRQKVGLVEASLLKVIEKIKQNSYVFHEHDFSNLQSLTGDEIIIGKITNLLSFIISKMHRQDSKEVEYLRGLQSHLKQRVFQHLYDTSYYDQYIKLIQKNKKNRNEYENKLTTTLKTQYRLKRELAMAFANKLMTEINNGTITREKELMEDIREHRLDILGVSNKAAIDRCIEHLTPKYM